MRCTWGNFGRRLYCLRDAFTQEDFDEDVVLGDDAPDLDMPIAAKSELPEECDRSNEEVLLLEEFLSGCIQNNSIVSFPFVIDERFVVLQILAKSQRVVVLDIRKDVWQSAIVVCAILISMAEECSWARHRAPA